MSRLLLRQQTIEFAKENYNYTAAAAVTFCRRIGEELLVRRKCFKLCARKSTEWTFLAYCAEFDQVDSENFKTAASRCARFKARKNSFLLRKKPKNSAKVTAKDLHGKLLNFNSKIYLMCLMGNVEETPLAKKD